MNLCGEVMQHLLIFVLGLTGQSRGRTSDVPAPDDPITAAGEQHLVFLALQIQHIQKSHSESGNDDILFIYLFLGSHFFIRAFLFDPLDKGFLHFNVMLIENQRTENLWVVPLKADKLNSIRLFTHISHFFLRIDAQNLLDGSHQLAFSSAPRRLLQERNQFCFVELKRFQI